MSHVTPAPVLGFSPTASATDRTGSRARGTVYQNTSDHLMAVSAQFDDSDGSRYTLVFATSPDNVTFTNIGVCASADDQRGFLYGLVPPGYHYRISGSGVGIRFWGEYV